MTYAHPSSPNSQLASGLLAADNAQVQVRLRIRIPYHFQQEPIISTLISQYDLTVNIAAALLGVDMGTDGWFDLELRGRRHQIASAIIYLNDLDIEILDTSGVYLYNEGDGD